MFKITFNLKQGDTAHISFIPPSGMGELTPVMTQLEIVLQAINVNNVKLENLRFHHSSYNGLDQNMNWQHAAVVIKRSNGQKYFFFLKYLVLLKYLNI